MGKGICSLEKVLVNFNKVNNVAQVSGHRCRVSMAKHLRLIVDQLVASAVALVQQGEVYSDLKTMNVKGNSKKFDTEVIDKSPPKLHHGDSCSGTRYDKLVVFTNNGNSVFNINACISNIKKRHSIFPHTRASLV